MKKLILVLSAVSILSMSAFANNSMYKSTESVSPSSSSVIKEEQQRMEDGTRTKVKETRESVRQPEAMKKKVETKKTEYKSDGMAE